MADSSGTGRGRDRRNQTSRAGSRSPPVRHTGLSTSDSSNSLRDQDQSEPGPALSSSGSTLQSQASSFSLHDQFATSRREFEFDEDEETLEPAPLLVSRHGDAPDEHYLCSNEEGSPDIGDNITRRLMNANEESHDYYTLLGLSREPPPAVAEIRAAYHRLSLAFHPDKQPHYLKASAQKYFTKLQRAYETLIEPRKRVIYDLEGEEGVQNEFSAGGAMGPGGEAEKQLGVKSMGADEFRKWFMGVLLERERRSLAELVGSTSTCKVVMSAEDLFTGSRRVLSFRSEVTNDAAINVPDPLITIQELQFRQGFSVPLPGLASLLQSRLPSWKNINRGELSTNKKGGNAVLRSSWEESVGPSIPKLTFLGSVSGITVPALIMRPSDAEDHIPPLFRWYTLKSESIQVSARLNHTFTDTRDRERITSVTSLMNGVDLDVTTGVLPRRTLDIGLGRQFTLVRDTTPFYIHVRSLFNSPLSYKPPVLELGVHRRLGAGRFGYCSWSSGDVGWPVLDLMTRATPMTFSEVPFGLPQGLLTSRMSIGYSKIGDWSQMLHPNDIDGMTTFDADNGNREKARSSGIISNEPSWNFSVSSSPHNATVSMTWSQDLFSHAAEQPVRSRVRKSGEAVARSRDFDVPFSRGIRLELEGSIGLDLSLSGILRGVRRVGNFTNVSIGVGLNPWKGLFISLSWSRLGQNIIVPVMLFPWDSLNLKSIIGTFTAPWAMYMAIEFGILRPRLQRRRQELTEETRKELHENVSRRKVEAEEATFLMRPSVEYRQAQEREAGGLVILRAQYGVQAGPSEAKIDSWRRGEVGDVTVALAALVHQSQLSLPPGLNKAQILGFWDSEPMTTHGKKKLVVDYLFNGKKHHVECAHRSALSLPMRAHEV